MINKRALLILLAVTAFFIVLVINLFKVQVQDHEKYEAKASRQQNKSILIKPERGIIKDRNCDVLVYTKDDISFFADTRMMNSWRINTISNKFAKIFNKKKNFYTRLLKSKKNEVCLVKKTNKENALKLENFVVDGLVRKEDHTRVYAYDNTASHLLGYVNGNSKGLAGIEKIYDEELSGTAGRLYIERDVIGRTVTVDYELSKQAIPGNNLILTIDSKYQEILEEELVKGIEKYKGNAGVGIMMNPQTGEIIALANLPDFKPASYSKFSNQDRRNKVLTDPYEPGSTVKALSMALMMEEDIIKDNEIINTENGKYRVFGTYIRDTHKYDRLTVKEVFAHSSNIGMSKLIDRIDDDDFYRGLRDFGLGNKSFVNLIGEAQGFLKKPKSYSKISKYFMSYGYELTATPLQMISAYSALVNGGSLLKPYAVKEIQNYKGETLETFEKEFIREVISKETSDRMIDYMVAVVEDGTGDSARIKGVSIGGKTGTAQLIVDGGYSKKKHNSSFIGFLPADDPKLVCLILINAPQVGRYGGMVAAPIFRNVISRVLKTDYNLYKSNEKTKVFGEDEIITSNVKFNKSEKNVYANKPNKQNELKKSLTTNKMPDLTGLSMREAISVLTELNLKYSFSGKGRVKSQSIKPGTLLKENMKCEVKFGKSKKFNAINLVK